MKQLNIGFACCKTLLLVTVLIITSSNVLSQEKNNFFNDAKFGASIHGFWSMTGKYVYVLQPNARVVEKQRERAGAGFSVVLLFPISKNDLVNLVINLPVADYSSSFSVFNKDAPIGIGLSYFFKNTPNVGVGLMANFGSTERLEKDALEGSFYAIDMYPNSGLRVHAPVPKSVLEPSLYKTFTMSVNCGVFFRPWSKKT
jgi:hypothetical protein